MAGLIEKTPDMGRNALGNYLAQATTRATEAKSGQGMLARGRKPAENIQAVKEELDAVRREQAKLQQAIYEAAQVQRRLCAPRELTSGEFEIAGEIFPVRHLSGDFFKVMELDPVLGLAVGDIAGKGLTAGIWQTHLLGLIQRCARSHSDAADAVAEVNRELCQDQDERPMTALFFARLDRQGNELAYCNAGLPAPLLIRQDTAVERLEIGGPMLGALPRAEFHSGKVRLNPGDMLIAFSDGVTECRNSGDEEFGMDRLSAAAEAVRGASANQALFSTLAAVLDFAGECPPGDDLTLLVVRRRGGIMNERARSGSKYFLAPRRRPISVARPKKGDRRGNDSK
ncbi:MAG: serine/threonine-protein phosphatase [Acidobacteria bacterium]|nr:MAG: serine/threonine-protein phosphatase [Acidobacteriota bacterium]